MKITIQLDNNDLQQLDSLDINSLINQVMLNHQQEICNIIDNKIMTSIKKHITSEVGYDYYKNRLNNEKLETTVNEIIESQTKKAFSDPEFKKQLESDMLNNIKKSIRNNYKRYL